MVAIDGQHSPLWEFFQVRSMQQTSFSVGFNRASAMASSHFQAGWRTVSGWALHPQRDSPVSDALDRSSGPPTDSGTTRGTGVRTPLLTR
jgi:hypothetical protein